MGTLASLLFFFATIITVSDAAWCVCRSDVSDAAQQKTLDYACGAGADCSPIHENGACYNPNTVPGHCSYAANSYYQRKGQGQGACDFAGSATLTTTDPSGNGCTYPATPSAAGTSTPTTPGTTPVTPPSTSTPVGMAPPTTTAPAGMAPPTTPTPTGMAPPSSFTTPGVMAPPSTFTPSTGTGGVLGGLGPSGNGMSTDISDGGFLREAGVCSLLLTIFFFSFLVLLRG